MSIARLGIVFRSDAGQSARRPLFWILTFILALMAWGLSTGSMRISSGDSSVGGTKAWITSEFANAQVLSQLVFLFYLFFVAIAAGMAIIQDDEKRVGELLHATPLRPSEYLWGKFLAVVVSFLGVLTIHLALMMFFNHLVPSEVSKEVRGPWSPLAYVIPAIAFALPTILFTAGVSLMVGERTRKPILIFVLPLAMFLASVFFLWEWSPTWLDPRINRALMLIDPAGFRWLNETWLKVDRGVEFYNKGSIGFDPAFIASRLAYVAIGLAAVMWSTARFAKDLRGSTRKSRKAARLAANMAPGTATLPAAHPGAQPDSLPASLPGAQPAAHPAIQPGMQPGATVPVWDTPLATLTAATPRGPRGVLAGALDVARFELRELRSQPGLYLFVPIILIQILGNVLTSLAAFDTPLLRTPGNLAVRSTGNLTILGCLLLLFYTLESLRREKATGFGSIFYATPVRTGSILLGKSLANLFVILVIVLTALVACIIGLLLQGKVGIDIGPFALVWGALVIPTWLAWIAFVTLIFALTESRNATLGLGMAVLVLTGFMRLTNRMNWAGNWSLWNVLRWSDMAGIEPNGTAVLFNRITVLGLAVLFAIWALRIFARRDRDATLLVNRLRPGALLRGAWRLAPFALVPLVGLALQWVLVEKGFQGKLAEKASKDYWRKNLATWKDAPLPVITHADIDLGLEPSSRSFKLAGSYRMKNITAAALARIPITTGASWSDIKWTLNGDTCSPVNRVGLYVVAPKTPLAPGDSLTLGFTYRGTWPKGFTKDGGGMMEFILPAGIVLTSFEPTFVPVIGYKEDIGIDKQNRYESKDYPDDFYKGINLAADGGGAAYSTHIVVHAPEAYTINSVGVLESDTVKDGTRTSTWVSDQPVRFFNVVAGKWAVRRGEGTAVFYNPKHTYNIEEISQALDAARKYYSEWFIPFPWKELKLSEFPALADYAQGFPTNITFSESIGFLTKSEPKTNLAYLVTAHEAAHQWWGNMLSPGKGPGGDILSEGMAHFSTLLLIEQGKGLRDRIEFAKRIEERYGDRRVVNSERPLVKIDGTHDGDQTVTYDKGGWAAWMLLNHMGRESALAGCRAFLTRYRENPDHPLLQDFVATMREFAPDTTSFDAFVKQWYFEVVVPEYRLYEAKRTQLAGNGGWEVTVDVENIGTGTMPVEIAAERGERFPNPAKSSRAPAPGLTGMPASGVAYAATTTATSAATPAASPAAADSSAPSSKIAKPYAYARETIVLNAGEKKSVTIRMNFEPERIVVDPDALVLQLDREHAIHRF